MSKRDKIFRKWFIYNKTTRNCLSDKLYTDSSIGQKKLEEDFSSLKREMPTIDIGESTFDYNTKRLVDQNPPDVKKIKYPKDAAAELYEPKSQPALQIT